jgi:hypothetical protein
MNNTTAPSSTPAPVTAQPERTLAQCEAIIDMGLTTFIQVGEALEEIRERRLYRETHKTFDEYCRDRWGMSRIHAHRLITAAEVTAVLPTGNGTTVPRSERALRELVPGASRGSRARRGSVGRG